MNPKKIGITIASALFVLIGGITGVQYLQDSPEESSSSDALTASGSETTVAATETYQTTAATETTTVSMQTTGTSTDGICSGNDAGFGCKRGILLYIPNRCIIGKPL